MQPRMIKKKIFYETNTPQGKLFIRQNAPQAGFFDQVLMVTLYFWFSMQFRFHKSQLRIFFFQLIN